jgi:predicted RNA binding protein YcfA (HicA-like mRNA interferase family)
VTAGEPVRAGFQPVRQTGSHIRLVMGERSTSVPMHAGNVPRGLLAAILKQAGLTADDLRRLL